MENKLNCDGCGKEFDDAMHTPSASKFKFCGYTCKDKWILKHHVDDYMSSLKVIVSISVFIVPTSDEEMADISDPDSEVIVLVELNYRTLETDVNQKYGSEIAEFDPQTKKFIEHEERRDGTRRELTFVNRLEMAEKVIEILNQ